MTHLIVLLKCMLFNVMKHTTRKAIKTTISPAITAVIKLV